MLYVTSPQLPGTTLSLGVCISQECSITELNQNVGNAKEIIHALGWDKLLPVFIHLKLA